MEPEERELIEPREAENAELRATRAQLIAASESADWQQVVMNGGPPCFHLEDNRFCLRAERWGGHGIYHKFTPLGAAIGAMDF